ncbi:MAG: hypothetical protein QOI95_3536 [Acidimicrobiaceae bacterium]
MTAVGLRCGHEQVFGPRTRQVPDLADLDGEASWLAAPFVAQLPRGTAVLHQVRDPFATVSSWFGLRFLADGGPYSFRRPSGPPRLLWHEVTTRMARRRGECVYVARDYERFVARHLPWAVRVPSTLDRCMRYWTGWNEMVERGATDGGLPYLRYQLDDIEARWPEILDLVGIAPTELPDMGELGSSAGPPNARPHHDALTPEMFEASPEFPRLQELAIRYGFDGRAGLPPC